MKELSVSKMLAHKHKHKESSASKAMAEISNSSTVGKCNLEHRGFNILSGNRVEVQLPQTHCS